jgi:hypothetical protein
MSAGEHDPALREIAYAMHYLLRRHYQERGQVDASYLRSHIAAIPFPSTMTPLRDVLRGITQAIEGAYDNISFINLGLSAGLDFARWERFRLLTPRIIERQSGELLVERRGVRPTLDHCRFCYDFVIDSALRLQEQRG